MKYTEDRAIEAWILRQKGLSGTKIGKRFKISADTAGNWCRIVENNPTLRTKAESRKDLMKQNNSSQSKYSDAKAIKVHQLRLAGLSWSKIHDQMGIAISTACAWDRIVVEDPELKRAAETEKHPTEGNGKASMESPTTKDVTLKEENEYLRWWNQGERRGWVDRLLREIQK